VDPFPSRWVDGVGTVAAYGFWVIEPTGDNELARQRLLATFSDIACVDDIAHQHRQTAEQWVRSGAPLWRTEKPATPPMHLVSYFQMHDPETGRFLLVEHLNAGLLLPTGGHVEPGEDPWATVVRECSEELRYVPDKLVAPSFLTVTTTIGSGQHTDVSLWYTLQVPESTINWYDPGEFAGTHWLSRTEILNTPSDQLDPHMHRYLSVVA